MLTLHYSFAAKTEVEIGFLCAEEMIVHGKVRRSQDECSLLTLTLTLIDFISMRENFFGSICM
jgi:hypothetical protein